MIYDTDTAYNYDDDDGNDEDDDDVMIPNLAQIVAPQFVAIDKVGIFLTFRFSATKANFPMSHCYPCYPNILLGAKPLPYDVCHAGQPYEIKHVFKHMGQMNALFDTFRTF